MSTTPMGSLHYHQPRQSGPVTHAIRAMRAADPEGAELRRLRDLRAAISRQIESDLERIDRCLSFLDRTDGDTDLEADHVVYQDGERIGITSDDEETDSHQEDDDPFEETALEREGSGFYASGQDDAEADDNGVADIGGVGEQGFPYGAGDCDRGAFEGGSGL